MKLRDLWNYLSTILEEDHQEGRVTARLLLMSLLNLEYHQFVIQLNEEINKDICNKAIKDAKRVIEGEPIQYVLGKQEFYGLEFHVDENVLIPRPETELLVEEVIKLLPDRKARLIDLGTGSGAIAISVANAIDDIKITAIDISQKALTIAKKNAALNKVFEKIEFCESDLFSKIEGENYDGIVSNPPYVTSLEMNSLEKNVKREPFIALYGGEDGLYFYKKIAGEGYKLLRPGGFLALEIGFKQGESVKRLLKQAGFSNIYVLEDFSAKDRVVIGIK